MEFDRKTSNRDSYKKRQTSKAIAATKDLTKQVRANYKHGPVTRSGCKKGDGVRTRGTLHATVSLVEGKEPSAAVVAALGEPRQQDGHKDARKDIRAHKYRDGVVKEIVEQANDEADKAQAAKDAKQEKEQVEREAAAAAEADRELHATIGFMQSIGTDMIESFYLPEGALQFRYLPSWAIWLCDWVIFCVTLGLIRRPIARPHSRLFATCFPVIPFQTIEIWGADEDGQRVGLTAAKCRVSEDHRHCVSLRNKAFPGTHCEVLCFAQIRRYGWFSFGRGGDDPHHSAVVPISFESLQLFAARGLAAMPFPLTVQCLSSQLGLQGYVKRDDNVITSYSNMARIIYASFIHFLDSSQNLTAAESAGNEFTSYISSYHDNQPIAPGRYIAGYDLKLSDVYPSGIPDFVKHQFKGSEKKFKLRVAHKMSAELPARVAPVAMEEIVGAFPSRVSYLNTLLGYFKRFLVRTPPEDPEYTMKINCLVGWIRTRVGGLHGWDDTRRADLDVAMKEHARSFGDPHTRMYLDYMRGVDDLLSGTCEVDPDVYNTFIKAELASPEELKVPRNIFTPDCYLRGWTAALYYISWDNFFQVFGNHCIKHARSSAAYTAEVFEGYSGPVLCNDFKSMESQITNQDYHRMTSILRECSTPSFVDKFDRIRHHSDIFFRNNWMSLSRSYANASGQYSTSGINWLKNFFVHFSVLYSLHRKHCPTDTVTQFMDEWVDRRWVLEGDDSVIEFPFEETCEEFERLTTLAGARVSVSIAPDFSQAKFCRSYYAWFRNGWLYFRNPIHTILGLCVIHQPILDSLKADVGLQLAKLMSFFGSNPQYIPISSEFAIGAFERLSQMNPRVAEWTAAISEEFSSARQDIHSKDYDPSRLIARLKQLEMPAAPRVVAEFRDHYKRSRLEHGFGTLSFEAQLERHRNPQPEIRACMLAHVAEALAVTESWVLETCTQIEESFVRIDTVDEAGTRRSANLYAYMADRLGGMQELLLQGGLRVHEGYRETLVKLSTHGPSMADATRDAIAAGKQRVSDGVERARDGVSDAFRKAKDRVELEYTVRDTIGPRLSDLTREAYGRFCDKLAASERLRDCRESVEEARACVGRKIRYVFNWFYGLSSAAILFLGATHQSALLHIAAFWPYYFWAYVFCFLLCVLFLVLGLLLWHAGTWGKIFASFSFVLAILFALLVAMLIAFLWPTLVILYPYAKRAIETGRHPKIVLDWIRDRALSVTPSQVFSFFSRRVERAIAPESVKKTMRSRFANLRTRISSIQSPFHRAEVAADPVERLLRPVRPAPPVPDDIVEVASPALDIPAPIAFPIPTAPPAPVPKKGGRLLRLFHPRR